LNVSVLRSRPILAVLSLILFLAITEIVGRLVIPDNPPRADGFASDPTLGWILPAATTMQWRGRAARINQLGLRGPEPRTNPAARILMVGDSSMFGDGVKDGETMPAQLARLLPNVDVQNGGVPGYTCIQTREWIARLDSRFRPDILVSYNQHSDFRKASNHDQVVAGASLGPLVGTGIGRLLTQGILWMRISSGRSNLSLGEYRSCLEDLVESQKEHGGHTIFVVPFSTDDFPSSPIYGLPGPEPEGERLGDYRKAMREVAAKSDNLSLDGGEVVRGAGLTQGNSLQDVVHPTALGHQTLAQSIAAAIQKSGWIGVDPQKR
jgi:lysophospholipase L1-like esterase